MTRKKSKSADAIRTLVQRTIHESEVSRQRWHASDVMVNPLTDALEDLVEMAQN